VSAVCAACLRRSHLVACLAPRIAGLLDRPRRRPATLLALEENELIARVAGSGGAAAARFLQTFDARSARRRLVAARIDAVCCHEESYPAGLGALDDPPPVLYIAGGADRLRAMTAGPVATIVGTRRASPYALEVAYQLGRDVAAAGVTVVSGLALGIDAAAHRGALAGGGKALAVLGSGADVVSPRSNLRLYELVRERGVICSELPPGQRAFRWSFPARNRIMAGLGAITVVVEAADPSGSLITAAFAADIGREVGAVPGRVTARLAAGSNRLLRDGASVIRDADDVLDALFGARERHVAPSDRGPAKVSEASAEPAAEGPGRAPGLPTRPAGRAAEPLEPRLRSVLQSVEAGAGPAEIARDGGLSAADVRAALGRLELLGLVRRDVLGMYERTARR